MFGNNWTKPQQESEDSGQTQEDTEDNSNPQNDTPLDDLWTDLDRDYCDSVDVEGGPGATSYFIGYYTNQEGLWLGAEQWVLFPNDQWVATNGNPCQVTWSVSGTEGETLGCPGCDFSLFASAMVDMGETDCPEDLWITETELNLEYDVLLSNSTSDFYFHTSGTWLGTGPSSQTSISFISAPICQWF